MFDSGSPVSLGCYWQKEVQRALLAKFSTWRFRGSCKLSLVLGKGVDNETVLLRAPEKGSWELQMC